MLAALAQRTQQVIEVVLVYSLPILLALAVVTLGSLAAKPEQRRWRGLSSREVFRDNPDAALYVAWGRHFPLLVRATLVALLANVGLGLAWLAL